MRLGERDLSKITAVKALGEIALRVNDLEKMRKFYADTFGLEEIGEFGHIAFFKIADGYSGHTAISFGLATSYVLSMSHKQGLSRYWPIIAAAGVGAMRVAAAKHFPTDVLVGAAVGGGTAFIVHRIRF